MKNQSCNYKKKHHSKKSIMSRFHTFDNIEWLKKRIPQKKLIDRTIKLKYLIHPAEMNDHMLAKKVFKRFDEDGNRRL